MDSLVFGGTLMTATFTLFPLLGRTPPPWRWSPDVLATSLGTHVVYVAAVALVDDLLDFSAIERVAALPPESLGCAAGVGRGATPWMTEMTTDSPAPTRRAELLERRVTDQPRRAGNENSALAGHALTDDIA